MHKTFLSEMDWLGGKIFHRTAPFMRKIDMDSIYAGIQATIFPNVCE